MRKHQRRAGIYIAVLGTAAIVTIIGLAGMAAWRLQGATANANADAAEARLYAEAAVDNAAYYLSIDSIWRTNRPQGTWWANVPFARGSFTIAGADPLDANFANRAYDPLVLTCTGYKGSAVHITSVTLNAQGVPIPALAMAIHTAGQFRVNTTGTVTVTGAPLSTNGNLRLDGAITGAAQCTTKSGSGTASGGVTTSAATKAMPPSGLIAMYQSLGTAIAPSGNNIQKVVLSPGNNPYGASTNSDGVYVLSTSSNVSITNARICGTLVIIAPGKIVTIQNSVFMQPARSDYPVLIVQGQLVLQADSTVPLSEATQGVNFNPTGSPYQGATNATMTDTYPSEIDGLVHCTDLLTIQGKQLIRGAVICESTDNNQAIYMDNTPQIIYDSTLYSTPPMGYTTSVNMKIAPNSWKQSVLP
jgi:hypothetical protein